MIDYSKYTDRQLVEAYNSIDKEKYKETFVDLLKHLKERNITEAMIQSGYYPAPVEGDIQDADCYIFEDEKGGVDIDGNYIPNRVSVFTRIRNLILSSLIMVYGIIGLINDDLNVKLSKSRIHHVHGTAAIVAVIGYMFGLCGLISVIIDHYDKRNNEHFYKRILRSASVIAFCLLVISVILSKS
jgi:hypothetical protein